MAFADAYRGKRVLITGHTGFKGSWLSEWLLALGAKITGLALPPPTTPSLFEQLELAPRLDHQVGDIRDASLVHRVVAATQPDFIFHLAAQPLVRLSYEQPVETFATNVMGTAHVLDAVRRLDRPCTIVVVTTDKCYENREWVHSYREEDPLGGHDPYSASKGAAEIVTAAFRKSYFSAALRADGRTAEVRIASARAGNVIGGGDWALDRIVPDAVRALVKGHSIPVRNKVATRPWQHVLEPLSGYLWLGACLAEAPALAAHSTLEGAFNFGPALSSNRTVKELIEKMLRHWPGSWEDRSDPRAVHEAKLLNLATDKAQHLLGWQPVWNFTRTIEHTATWYRAAIAAPAQARPLVVQQIAAYGADAKALNLPWTQ